ncbi:MAG: glycosyltransferase family 2 protein [Firmicutes bacterium]|nr:glycosyltransferase family 2 protein [Bacillota bacterium]
MKFSVIIPIYNTEKYLEQCIDSILGGKFQDFELICVDDGSTDKCPQILKYYKSRNKNIRVITTKNNGQSKARNVGLDVAVGEYICFCDSDDIVTADWLARFFEILDSNKTIDMIFSGHKNQIVDPELKTINDPDFFDKYYPENKKEDFFSDLDLARERGEVWGCVWRLCVRREVIEKHKLRFLEDCHMHEDGEFMARLFAVCKTFFMDSGKNYIYRRRLGSLCTADKTESRVLLELAGDLLCAYNATLFVKDNPTLSASEKIRLISGTNWNVETFQRHAKKYIEKL